MPEYLAPGVYIEEIERGPKPIEGVATSTAAFLGETERGPTWPRLITSYNEYLRLFGDVFDDGKYMPYAVKAFFDNGGRRVYITRIAGEGATPARGEFAGITVIDNRPRARRQPHLGSRRAGHDQGQRWQVQRDSGCRSSIGIGCRKERIRSTRSPTRRDDFRRPSLTEDFDDLSLDPNSPNYWGKRINNGDPEVSGNSSLVYLDGPAWRGDPGLLRGRTAGRRHRRSHAASSLRSS